MKIEDMKHGLPVRHQDGTRGTLAHNMTEWFLMHADGRRCLDVAPHEVEPWEPHLGEWVTVGRQGGPYVSVKLIQALSLSRNVDLVLGIDVYGRILRLELSGHAKFMPYHATVEPLNVYGSPEEKFAVRRLDDPTNCIPLSEARLRSRTDQRSGGIAGVRATAIYADEARECPVTEELASQVDGMAALEKECQARRVPFGFGYGKGAVSFQHALQASREDVPSEELARRKQLEETLERKYWAQFGTTPRARDGHYPTPPRPDEKIELPASDVPREPAIKANAVCYHCAGRAYETPFSQTCLETVCALPEPDSVTPSPWWGHNENKWAVTGIPTTIYHPDKDTAVALWKAAAMAYRRKMWRP